ncbi:hypothetical protein EQ845_16120 [Pseudomonas putida]|nr:hypothetical protein EQ845_16120 [Pseudomonas putida]
MAGAVEGGCGGAGFGLTTLCCLCRPLRGQSRSYGICTAFKYGAAPVGAGLPAKRPAQAD